MKFGYYKVGDIVVDSEKSVWGKTRFEIYKFTGNWYCPIACSYIIGKRHSNGRNEICNLNVNNIRLIGAVNRPLRKIENKVLYLLISRGNIEAKRELKIRINLKRI